MKFRVMAFLPLLFLFFFYCNKANQESASITDSSETGNVVSISGQSIFYGKIALPLDTLALKRKFVAVKNSNLFETPSRFACFSESSDPGSTVISKGEFAWEVSSTHTDAKSAFIPVYICNSEEEVKMYWVKKKTLRLYKDTSSIYDIIAPETVNGLFAGALASQDSVLVSWLLKQETRLDFTHQIECLLRKMPNRYEMYSQLRPFFTPDPQSIGDDRFDSLYWDCHMGNIKAIKAYIADDKVDWKRDLTRISQSPQKNTRQCMFRYLVSSIYAHEKSIRCFEAIMSLATPEFVRELTSYQIMGCINASFFHPDPGLISKFMGMCNRPTLDTILPRILDRYAYDRRINLLITEAAAHVSGIELKKIHANVLANAIRSDDSALCATMFKKGTTLDDTKPFFPSEDHIPAACAMKYRDSHPVSDDQVLAVVRLLKESGANINGLSLLSYNKRVNALYLAAYNGLPKVADYLINQGVALDDPYKVTYRGFNDSCYDGYCQVETPLIGALRMGHRAIAQLLLQHGAKLEGPGYNALAAACYSNDVSFFKTGYEKGLSVDSTHLMIAAYSGSDSIVGYLLGKRPDLNRIYNVQFDNTNCTASAMGIALFGASYHDRADYWNDSGRYERTVSLLLDAGCSLTENATIRSEPLLPVEIAANSRRFDLVNLLLKRGALVSGKVLSRAVWLPDPYVINDYLPLFSKQNETRQVSLDIIEYCVNMLGNVSGRGAVDTTALEVLKNFYRQHAKTEGVRMRTAATARIAEAALATTVDSARFAQIIVDSLRHFESYISTGVLIGPDYGGGYRENEVEIKFSQRILDLPLCLAGSSELGDGQPTGNLSEWFAHYNPHLVDQLTKQLDNPAIAALVVSIGKQLPVKQSMLEYVQRLPAFTYRMLKEYRQVMAKGGAATVIARYDDYFRDPFGKSINNSFSDFSCPAAASFWARRMIDGSADSFYRLFTRISALFPDMASDGDESEDGSEDDGSEPEEGYGHNAHDQSNEEE